MREIRAGAAAAALALGSALAADVGRSGGGGIDPATCGLLKDVAPAGGDLTSAAFSPDGRLLALACMDGTVRLLEAPAWKEIRRIPAHPNGVKAVAWGPDGKMLVTGGSLAVKIWDAATGAERRSHFPGGFDPGAQRTFGLACSPVEDALLFAAEDGILRRWTGFAGEGEPAVAAPEGPYRAAAYSRGGRLAAAAAGGVVRVWRTDLWELRHTLPAGREVQSVTFSPDGRRLAAGASGMAVLWDLGRGLKEVEIEGFAIETACLAFTPDGRHLIGSGPGGEVRLCEAASGREVAVLRRPAEPFTAVAVHPGGKFFATAGPDRHLRVWGPVPAGAERLRPPGFCGIRVQQDAEGRVAVVEVLPGTAAERARLGVGDLILAVNGVEVRTPTEVIDQISSRFEGEEAEFRIVRDREVRSVRVRLGRRPPEEPER